LQYSAVVVINISKPLGTKMYANYHNTLSQLRV